VLWGLASAVALVVTVAGYGIHAHHPGGVWWLLAGALILAAWALGEMGRWRTLHRRLKAEMKRRLETLRYAPALVDRNSGGFGGRLSPNADGTCDVTIWFGFTNSAAEPLWYTITEMITVIDGRRSGEDDALLPHGVILAPQQTATPACPPVRGVRLPWQEATFQFTIRYGHPEGALAHARSQTYRLSSPRQYPAGQDVKFDVFLISDSGVKDSGRDQIPLGAGRTGTESSGPAIN
jgi:hypothetical protein